MSCNVATFRVRFPEFSDDTDFPDLRIQLFLDDARDCYMGTDENRWCNTYDKAQCYLGAHLLALGTGSEAGDTSTKAGPISAKTAGGVSITRAVSSKVRSDGDEFFMGTSYGQQFISLRNMCFVGVLAANQL